MMLADQLAEIHQNSSCSSCLKLIIFVLFQALEGGAGGGAVAVAGEGDSAGVSVHHCLAKAFKGGVMILRALRSAFVKWRHGRNSLLGI